MKKWLVIICIALVLVMLIPIPLQMKDGGTVVYDAILYDIYDVHRIAPLEYPKEDRTYETGFIEGTIIKIFGIEVFNNTTVD